MKMSAGLLVYKQDSAGLRVFLVHPGGPYWARKDEGVWSIPKGEFAEGEDPLAAARREFLEETGQAVEGRFIELPPSRQPSRKVLHIFAVEGEVDEDIRSNEFEIEWPPRSGRLQRFPEVDRAAWFTVDEARRRIQRGQVPILDELTRRLGEAPDGAERER
jgi:predicted NUDIX family NTP pyrophosphohydrolase